MLPEGGSEARGSHAARQFGRFMMLHESGRERGAGQPRSMNVLPKALACPRRAHDAGLHRTGVEAQDHRHRSDPGDVQTESAGRPAAEACSRTSGLKAGRGTANSTLAARRWCPRRCGGASQDPRSRESSSWRPTTSMEFAAPNFLARAAQEPRLNDPLFPDAVASRQSWTRQAASRSRMPGRIGAWKSWAAVKPVDRHRDHRDGVDLDHPDLRGERLDQSQAHRAKDRHGRRLRRTTAIRYDPRPKVFNAPVRRHCQQERHPRDGMCRRRGRRRRQQARRHGHGVELPPHGGQDHGGSRASAARQDRRRHSLRVRPMPT